MTTFNTNIDLDPRGDATPGTRATAKVLTLQLANLLRGNLFFVASPPDELLEKAARREAARRAVDNLLR